MVSTTLCLARIARLVGRPGRPLACPCVASGSHEHEAAGQRGGGVVRSPARARRDAQAVKRDQVARAGRSSRASGLEPPDSSEASRESYMPISANARFVDDKQGTDRVVRRRADSQPLRARAHCRQTTLTSRGRAAMLHRHHDEDGAARAWRPEIEDKTMTMSRPRRASRERELLGVDRGLYCPHGGGPPCAGAGSRYRDSRCSSASSARSGQCVYVGAGPQDPGLRAASAFSIATHRTSSDTLFFMPPN